MNSKPVIVVYPWNAVIFLEDMPVDNGRDWYIEFLYSIDFYEDISPVRMFCML